MVSIHARARRATLVIAFDRIELLFQSTPARGGRPAGATLGGEGDLFQSTPARGGRPRVLPMSWQKSSFNPRPRAAGDCHA